MPNRIHYIIALLIFCVGGSYAANAAQSEISIISAMSVLLPKSAGAFALFNNRNAAEFTQGVWLSQEYGGVSFYDGKNADALFYGFEAGYERNIDGGYRAGLSAEYNSGDAKIDGHPGAKFSNEFYSIALYGSKIWQNGAFAQIAVKNFFINSDGKNPNLNYSLERNAVVFFGEAGKEINLGSFIFEPKISLNYFTSGAQEAENINFGAVSLLDAKISLLLNFAGVRNGFNLSPYIGAGFGYSFLGESEIIYNAQTFISDISGALLEAVLGVRAVFSDSLNAAAGFKSESAQYGSSYGFALSIQYSFGHAVQKAAVSQDDLAYRDYVGFKPIVAKDNPKTENFFEEEFADFIPVEEYFPVVQPIEGFQKEEDFDIGDLNSGLSEENVKRVYTVSKKDKSYLSDDAKIADEKDAEQSFVNASGDLNLNEENMKAGEEVIAEYQNIKQENYKEGSGKKLTLGSAFFKPGQSEIDQKGKAYLKQIADMIKGVKIKKIVFTGHTDPSGDGEAFMSEAISENRAASAAAALISNGIPESKIKFKGAGSSKPRKIKKKKNQKDKSNRRVEIEIFE
ncbi:MAG: OmpA family protein [Endomicrobium sp.]|jgi:outer membrane protein OmpA-like peptidoglycan-associated protein|nr:OmpA family protein [Endomicrobium sp.]